MAALPWAEQARTGHGLPPSAASVITFTFTRVRSLCATTVHWVRYRRHRRRALRQVQRPFVGLFAGGELPQGIPTPSLPFLLCETENPNPNSICLFDAY